VRGGGDAGDADVYLALTVKALQVMQFFLKGRQGRRGDTLVDRGQGPL